MMVGRDGPAGGTIFSFSSSNHSQPSTMAEVTPTTVVYKKLGDLTLYIDVYPPTPKSDGPVPAVVYFHGGGMTVGHRTSHFPTWLQSQFFSLLPLHANNIDWDWDSKNQSVWLQWASRLSPQTIGSSLLVQGAMSLTTSWTSSHSSLAPSIWVPPRLTVRAWQSRATALGGYAHSLQPSTQTRNLVRYYPCMPWEASCLYVSTSIFFALIYI